MDWKQWMWSGTAAALGALLGAAAPGALAQGIDVCGCASSPTSLGAFRSFDPATWPPGTTLTASNQITIPLPPDGVLIFDSFEVNNTAGNAFDAVVRFARNAANTPVTLLVRGNLTVAGNDVITVDGSGGISGTSTTAGVGGEPGPGGYAGGDGAYFSVNLANNGGAGFGPGGGVGGDGIAPLAEAGGGVLFSVPELRPMRGGSGGGGGYSTSAGNCSGGGGGGGSGSILIAANGTATINGTVRADGAGGGSISNSVCSRGGGGGSGGAIRIIANAIAGGGRIQASGGGGGFGGNTGSDGRIRMEAFTNTFGTNVAPTAQRLPSPGPVSNPVNPTVAITAIEGTPPPVNPRGYLGQIDLIVSEPGPVQIDLRTTDVPAGTDVEVSVKPKLNDPAVVQRLTLAPGDCVSGVCTTGMSVDLNPGSYIVEARATFEAP